MSPALLRRRRRSQSAVAAPFDFSSVANLAFQYDARNVAGANGAAVSAVSNYQGSASLDLASAAGEEFLIATGALNGNRVLRGRDEGANGGPSSLVVSGVAASLFSGARAFTGFFVASFRTVATNPTFLVKFDDGVGQGLRLSFDGAGNLTWQHGDVGLGKIALAYAPGTDPHVFEVYRSDNDYDLRIDGTPHTASIPGSASLDITAPAQFCIGARGAGVFGIIGDLALALGYKAALSAPDRAAVRTAITAITGLTC